MTHKLWIQGVSMTSFRCSFTNVENGPDAAPVDPWAAFGFGFIAGK